MYHTLKVTVMTMHEYQIIMSESWRLAAMARFYNGGPIKVISDDKIKLVFPELFNLKNKPSADEASIAYLLVAEMFESGDL